MNLYDNVLTYIHYVIGIKLRAANIKLHKQWHFFIVQELLQNNYLHCGALFVSNNYTFLLGPTEFTILDRLVDRRSMVQNTPTELNNACLK